MLHRVRGATGNKVPCPREYSRANVHRRHCQCVRPLFTASTTPGSPLHPGAMVSLLLPLANPPDYISISVKQSQESPTFPRFPAIQAAQPLGQSQSSHLLHSRQELAKLSILSLIGSSPLAKRRRDSKSRMSRLYPSLIALEPWIRVLQVGSDR